MQDIRPNRDSLTRSCVVDLRSPRSIRESDDVSKIFKDRKSGITSAKGVVDLRQEIIARHHKKNKENIREQALRELPPPKLQDKPEESVVVVKSSEAIKESIFSASTDERQKVSHDHQSQDTGSLRSILAEAFGRKMRRAFAYSFAATIMFLVIPVAIVAYRGFRDKGLIEQAGKSAYGNLKDAQASIEKADIAGAGQNFDMAYQNFLEARKKLDEVGGITTRVLNFVPGVSKVESGRELARTGEHISLAGKDIAAAAKLVMLRKDELAGILNFDDSNSSGLSLTEMVVSLEDNMLSATDHIEKAAESIARVNPSDFPREEREKVVMLKETLPGVHGALDEFLKYTDVFLEILGHNGERKYLMLFENNHEMRATGGFVGTYGIIKVDEGRIENIKVDGIYNPDGQLKERVVPPEPIQKMSATWTMHDANWWPDFPMSAEKVGWFYEKTGGPTVDGVIAITPKVIKDLLEVTGPIEMPEYEVTVTPENFMDQIQEQVEIKYDKTKNEPKKILADMTPKLMSRVASASPAEWSRILEIFSRSLKERHLMVYSFDYNIQKIVSDMGWSGEILATKKDYLSVVNTNISGFKTDGVIQQRISHLAEVQEDGSIIDTVTIERRHTGEQSEREWHNAVNSDWMRVYVPEGSQFIAASGFTREFVDSPLDYDKLGFKHDPQVKMMEDSYELDNVSATRIYKEKGKTVFANWAYVSPGETTTVSYKYLLPFKFDFANFTKPADTYSILFQKQAGEENTSVNSKITGLHAYDYIFRHPDGLAINSGGWEVADSELDTDIFLAVVAKVRE